MARRGRRKGDPNNFGRPTGIKNKATIAREEGARIALEKANVPPSEANQAVRMIGTPIRPQTHESLNNLRIIAAFFMGEASKEQRKPNPDLGKIRGWLKDAASVLRMITPFEFPTLAAVQVSGDPNRPVQHSHRFDPDELGKLSLQELAELYRETVGAGKGPSGQSEGSAH